MKRNVFRIVIQTTNDAFVPDFTGRCELSFILAGITERLRFEEDYPAAGQHLHDTNGNYVGDISWGPL